jgi:N-acetylglucosamine-6-phosphate deacetylase
MISVADPLVLDGRRYDTGEPVRVVCRGASIESVEPLPVRESIETWPWIAPGLFDLQINGHGGVWFCDPQLTAEQASRAIAAYWRFGVTRLCPTLITSSFEALAAGFAAIRAACEADPLVDATVAGCHLEGPYLSGLDGPRGAHPKDQIRPADWDEFSRLQALSGQRIRLVTIAPEVEGAEAFIRQAVSAGVVVSIGHTAANPEQIRQAVAAGARCSTHLGNGCLAQIHRHQNHLWPQLAEPKLTCCLILDGHHLPADFVQVCLQVKGVSNTVLTCDAAGWAGCPPGNYSCHLGQSEILESGKLVVAGQRELLAGSADETDVCVTKIREFTGVGWREAIDMTSRNPAKLLGCEPARLRRGGRAELFQFTHASATARLGVLSTVLNGVVVHGQPWQSP